VKFCMKIGVVLLFFYCLDKENISFFTCYMDGFGMKMDACFVDGFALDIPLYFL
jgi:hypothetical protein